MGSKLNVKPTQVCEENIMDEVEILNSSTQVQSSRLSKGDQTLTDLPETVREEKNLPGTSSAVATPKIVSEEDGQIKRPFYRRPRILMAIAGLLIGGILLGLPYYNHVISYESTDDAFIEGRIIQISPKVSGHILKVYVTDNQQVKEGDLLVELDPRDFEARLENSKALLQQAISKQKAAQLNVDLTDVTSQANVQQAYSGVQLAKSGLQTATAELIAARNRLEQTRAQVKTAIANAEQAQAQVAEAEAEATRANTDAQRYQHLYEQDGIISRQQLDYALSAARKATAQLEAARKQAAAAEARVAEARAAEQVAVEGLHQAEAQVAEAQARVGEAQARLASANTAPKQVAISSSQAEAIQAEIEQAQAMVKQDQLQLSYTKIYAPESGRVTRKMIEEGAFVQVGQALMAIVPDEFWVIANFKETQLASIRPGQPVNIKVDAYPDKIFKGHVDSIQAGTGARFSLLPPENATGNFVKVVQRVPVKIVFDEKPDSTHPLGPGMSVVPEVKVK
jgi:membrane fusion protein (multidrug efflux system)